MTLFSLVNKHFSLVLYFLVWNSKSEKKTFLRVLLCEFLLKSGPLHITFGICFKYEVCGLKGNFIGQVAVGVRKRREPGEPQETQSWVRSFLATKWWCHLGQVTSHSEQTPTNNSIQNKYQHIIPWDACYSSVSFGGQGFCLPSLHTSCQSNSWHMVSG